MSDAINSSDEWEVVDLGDCPIHTTLDDVRRDSVRVIHVIKNTAFRAVGVAGGILQITGSCITATGTALMWVSGN